jgi:G:T-mismatch repair DNA endonuclease (very short patch repair protein)
MKKFNPKWDKLQVDDEVLNYIKSEWIKIRSYWDENEFNESTIVTAFAHILRFVESNSVYDIFERVKKLRVIKNVVTKEKMLLMYGEREGIKRWDSYRNKQSVSNSQEYKGMTDEEFKKFNSSRAITREKCIARHGEEKGLQIWNNYCSRQSYTNTLEYFIEKYGDEGEQKWLKVNKQKAQTLENFIKKYGDEGEKKYLDYMDKSANFYSKSSVEFFNELDKRLNLESYHASKNKEFGKYCKSLKRYFKYDFVIPSLKFCIEFNGDMFHARPTKYSENDTPNPFKKEMTAKEIWEFDKIKNNELISLGFDILIIWESDYLNNKEDIINYTVQYIKDKYGII